MAALRAVRLRFCAAAVLLTPKMWSWAAPLLQSAGYRRVISHCTTVNSIHNVMIHVWMYLCRSGRAVVGASGASASPAAAPAQGRPCFAASKSAESPRRAPPETPHQA